MEIERKILEEIFGEELVNQHLEKIQPLLFIASKDSKRIKKLNLGGLTAEQRAYKLSQWAERNRYVAIIASADIAFAHAHPKVAAELKKQKDLKIEGKQVEVKSLTEEQYKRLSLVSQLFEEYLISEDKGDDEKDLKRQIRNLERQYFSKVNLLSDETKVDYLIAKMANIPHKVILSFLENMSEVQREINERNKEKALEEAERNAEQKHQRIKREAIKKDLLDREIENEAIEKQESKRTLL